MPETEKITINLGVVDLGQIDLLVEEGFYSNRTDFIRTAIRNQIAEHKEYVRETITRKAHTLGVMTYDKQTLEMFYERGEKLRISVVGLLTFKDDITPELFEATVESIKVFGVMAASQKITLLIETLGLRQ